MVKINSLEIENVKRIKAVKIKPEKSGLTVIGGKNNQGKTSVLDSIAWALGGNGFKPSRAARQGSVIPPRLHLVMSNGLVVERNGKNSDLKVIDPTGQKGGQQLLNEFVEQLALNLPKFMEASSKEKARVLYILSAQKKSWHIWNFRNRNYITAGMLSDKSQTRNLSSRKKCHTSPTRLKS